MYPVKAPFSFFLLVYLYMQASHFYWSCLYTGTILQNNFNRMNQLCCVQTTKFNITAQMSYLYKNTGQPCVWPSLACYSSSIAAESQVSGVFHNKSIHTQTEHALIATFSAGGHPFKYTKHSRITISTKASSVNESFGLFNKISCSLFHSIWKCLFHRTVLTSLHVS